MNTQDNPNPNPESTALAVARQVLETAQEALENATETDVGAERWRELTEAVTKAQEEINALTRKSTDTTSGQKRKFDCVLSDYIPQDDIYNQRIADGSLKELDAYPAFVDERGRSYVNGSDLPADYDYGGNYEALVKLSEINEKPIYDTEANALGMLPRNFYMLIPMSCTAKVCPLEDVGAGCDKYQVGIPDIAGVYALAKDQAKNITTNPNEQIKWAVLRLEAFMAGWYDNQKHCLRADAPKDSIRIMLTDMKQILKYANQAWVLCGFIPFFIEFNFRTNSSTFTSQTLTEYKQKAEKFARSAQLPVSLDYMKADVLFGDAFRWIGVRRPMNVLKSNNPYIPNVFLVRKHAAPAGQAMITSANAVINSLKGANWWAPIRVKGGYNDEIIETLAGNIYKDPWKYHQLASSYGLGGLNQAELDAIKDARDLVVRMAPVLQAYMDTFLKSSDLGKVKVLYKHALRSPHFYIKMKQKFQSILRRKPKNLAEAFAVYAFEDAPTGGNV